MHAWKTRKATSQCHLPELFQTVQTRLSGFPNSASFQERVLGAETARGRHVAVESPERSRKTEK